jgi:hypothetical protein
MTTKFRCYLLFLSLVFFSLIFIRIMSTRWDIYYFLYYIKTYGSHEMLHHDETKLFFCLMYMFELFEFEFEHV